MDKETLDKIRYYINKKKDVDTIASELGIERYQVYGLVQELINQGYLYDIVDGQIIKMNQPKKSDDIYQVKSNLEHLRLLLLSDTHLCSKYDRLDILRYLYDKAVDTGTNYCLHCGDFTDGRSNRPEHVYELKELSYEGQVQYCVENYPRVDEMPTFVISGNHDDWWYKSNGSEIVKSISMQRPDLHYLGADAADLKIGKLRIHMFHGKGAQAYAKSYKAQKYLDAMSVDSRPHILQLGHIHQAFFYQQDNTSVFQTGCLEDQTPFCKSQGFSDNKSVWWVDVYMDDKGNPQQIKQELETFGPRLVKRRK